MDEVLPDVVLATALDALQAAGYQIGRTPAGGGPARFATVTVKAPTGQAFQIQVEEL
ncbi:hypothetical protein ACQPZJ_01825 [Actinoplanes sp. CA-054009]